MNKHPHPNDNAYIHYKPNKWYIANFNYDYEFKIKSS